MSTTDVSNVRAETAAQTQEKEKASASKPKETMRVRVHRMFTGWKKDDISKGDVLSWLIGLLILFAIGGIIYIVVVSLFGGKSTKTVEAVKAPQTVTVAPHVDTYYSEDLTTKRRVLMKTNKEGLMQYTIDRTSTSAETLRAMELQAPPPKVEYRAPTSQSNKALILRWQQQNGRATQGRPYYQTSY